MLSDGRLRILFDKKARSEIIKKAPVSVVIPAYNSERYIRSAIKSVLEQSLPVDEIIVVDNNCTDQTVEIARQMGAVIVRETEQNAAAARNAGIRTARNDWIALLDSDDWWEKDKIKYQWKAVEMYLSARMVACRFQFIVNNQKLTEEPDPSSNDPQSFETGKIALYPEVTIQIFGNQLVQPSTFLIHREVFEVCGDFDQAFVPHEDFEFALRVFARYPLAYVHLPLSNYRRHDSSLTISLEGSIEARRLIVEQIHRCPEKYSKAFYDLFVEQLKRDFLKRAFLSNLNRHSEK